MKLKLVWNNKVSTPHPSPLTTGYSRNSLKRKTLSLPTLSDSEEEKRNKFWSRLQKTGSEMKSKLTNNNKRYNQVRLERTNTCWSRSPKKGSEMKSSWVHNKILHPHPSPLTTGRTRIPLKQTHPLTTLSDFNHDSTQHSKKRREKRQREHDTKMGNIKSCRKKEKLRGINK
jgi:hypothetical protein